MSSSRDHVITLLPCFIITKKSNMPERYHIKEASYYWLDTWVLANIIQLATMDFCKRFLNMKNDPCGRQFDQMTQAARSGQANIAEGNARHYTSRETEMKLTDVARASIAELAGDYTFWLLNNNQVPWSQKNSLFYTIAHTSLDRAVYTEDVQHESGLHILRQKERFDVWLKSSDSVVVANCVLILCNRLMMMLQKQMDKMLSSFREEGGFTETLTAERLNARTAQNINEGAPACPKCGKPMIKRVAKKGLNSGNQFWSCSDYPHCMGTRSI